jgi:hypothetical protein
VTLLYRTMKDDGEGMPLCGPTARELGVRLEGDIPIRDGRVKPHTGGMSVAIDTPENLPSHRRPKNLGGRSADPLWEIEDTDLPGTLSFMRDLRDPSKHGFVEPIEEMGLFAYQEALATSRSFWSRA